MAGFAAAGTLGLAAGYLLKTTVVLTLALLITAAAKRRPAAFRHFVLSAALAGLLLLPILSFLPVGWDSPLVPAWMGTALSRPEGRPNAAGTNRYGIASPVTDVMIGASGTDGHVADGITESPTVPNAGRPGSTGPIPSLRAAALGPGTDLAETGSNSPGRATKGGPGVLDLLVIGLWSAGLALLIMRLAFGLAGAVKLTAEGTPLVDPAWRIILERFLALVSLRRTVRLKSHPEVLVPLTWGWRKPVVLFPPRAEDWTDEERSSALFHELSHIKRADFLVMLLVRTSLALFWWNPLCWIVYRELLKAQESACDELVLRAGIRPSTYAASLLAFRRSAGFRWNPSAALLGMLGRSSFQERLAVILKHKLILMEVKMKTKIMLALAIVLAVALIGTARPAVGVERSTEATLIETALPGPGSFDIAPPAADVQQTQAEKAVVQEKQKEKEKAIAAEKAKEAEKAAKEGAAVEKTIVITTKEGTKTPIEITITEGDTVKTLVLEKSLTITKAKDGNVLILTPEGKEPLVLKGEPLRLEIKGGEIQVLKEGMPVKIEPGLDLKIAKELGEEGQTIVFYGKPEGKIAEGRAVKIVKEGEPGMAWTIKEGDKGMLEKVHALQEQVQAIKAKKMDLAALEESLKKLEAELKAKEEKLREIEYKFEKAPGAVTIVKKVRAGEDKGGRVWVQEKDEDEEAAEERADVWIYEKSQAAKDAKAKAIIRISDKEGEISLLFTGQDGEAGKAAFERATISLKKGLPEGYKLDEQKFDAEKGTMTFKIATPEGRKTDEALVRKLVELVQSEIKKK